MDKKNLLTYQGLQKLESELQDLKVVKRKEIAQKIKEAREQGDLSENAEYDAAKDEQRDIEARIEEIEKILRHAEVVVEEEANSLKGKISNESPVGKALLGAKVGDIVNVETQAGVLQYKVLEIQRSN